MLSATYKWHTMKIRISLKWIVRNVIFRRQMSNTALVYRKRFLHMKKNCILAVVERLFWQLGTRFSGRCRCREVAVVERWPLVEVQL